MQEPARTTAIQRYCSWRGMSCDNLKQLLYDTQNESERDTSAVPSKVPTWLQAADVQLFCPVLSIHGSPTQVEKNLQVSAGLICLDVSRLDQFFSHAKGRRKAYSVWRCSSATWLAGLLWTCKYYPCIRRLFAYAEKASQCASLSIWRTANFLRISTGMSLGNPETWAGATQPVRTNVWNAEK